MRESGSLIYQNGFGNEFGTEALEGALPQAATPHNGAPTGCMPNSSPAPRSRLPGMRIGVVWLYRIRPAAVHGEFHRIDDGALTSRFDAVDPSPNQLRWSPLAIPSEPTDFVSGLHTVAGNGSPEQQSGCGIHWYVANRSMVDRYFYDADGELLLVPQLGRLRLATELGILDIEPQQIAVIPRGLRFRVELPDGQARGYVCENFGAPFRLPRSGSDRLERPCQSARFSDPRGVVRGPDRRFRAGGQVHGPLLVGADRPTRRWMWWRGTETMRRTAMTCAVSTPSARSVSTTRTLRSSWCCSRSAIRRESIASTS